MTVQGQRSQLYVILKDLCSIIYFLVFYLSPIKGSVTYSRERWSIAEVTI